VEKLTTLDLAKNWF